jgi:L-lactate dehydrogenase complex protein LldG
MASMSSPVNQARRAILNRISRALAGYDEPVAAPSFLPSVFPEHMGNGESLLHRFTLALDRLSVVWEVAENPIAARLRLVASLQEEGVARVLTWADDQLPVPGVVETLTVLGIQPILPHLPEMPARLRPQDEDARRVRLRELEAVDVGLTGADAGFAASGTLVVSTGAGRPLLTSQLPRRHIVLLPVSRLFPTLEQWLRHLRTQGDLSPLIGPSHVALLTGPSQSADIELSPALGIHGPRVLQVILIEGS